MHITTVEEHEIEGVKLEVVHDDIGYYVKHDGKPVRSFHKQKPSESDLKGCLELI